MRKPFRVSQDSSEQADEAMSSSSFHDPSYVSPAPVQSSSAPRKRLRRNELGVAELDLKFADVTILQRITKVDLLKSVRAWQLELVQKDEQIRELQSQLNIQEWMRKLHRTDVYRDEINKVHANIAQGSVDSQTPVPVCGENCQLRLEHEISSVDLVGSVLASRSPLDARSMFLQQRVQSLDSLEDQFVALAMTSDARIAKLEEQLESSIDSSSQKIESEIALRQQVLSLMANFINSLFESKIQDLNSPEELEKGLASLDKYLRDKEQVARIKICSQQGTITKLQQELNDIASSFEKIQCDQSRMDEHILRLRSDHQSLKEHHDLKIENLHKQVNSQESESVSTVGVLRRQLAYKDAQLSMSRHDGLLSPLSVMSQAEDTSSTDSRRMSTPISAGDSTRNEISRLQSIIAHDRRDADALRNQLFNQGCHIRGLEAQVRNLQGQQFHASSQQRGENAGVMNEQQPLNSTSSLRNATTRVNHEMNRGGVPLPHGK